MSSYTAKNISTSTILSFTVLFKYLLLIIYSSFESFFSISLVAFSLALLMACSGVRSISVTLVSVCFCFTNLIGINGCFTISSSFIFLVLNLFNYSLKVWFKNLMAYIFFLFFVSVSI